MTIWRAAAQLARAGSGGALATVARTTGSTPVPVGTKMLVGPAGRLEGSVGGGCVEADVLEAAQAAAGHGPVIRTHHLNADIAGDLGLSCGGTVEIVVEPLVQQSAYVAALEAAAAAEQGTLTTALDWSRGPDKHFSPTADPAGPAASLSEDRHTLVEQLLLAPRVVVFGAGHVGSAIANAAAVAGFRVVVVDDRPEFANPERFSNAMRVITASVDGALAQVAIAPQDAVVIATRGHRHDAVILERVATSGAGYVGLLGSRRKQAVVTKALQAAGVPAAALERVRVPVGLAIGAETPEEIAVSVTAELIAWRRRLR
ncbi:MAG TPA: XdhC family protein [Gemmatimonadales bacterium]|nr:XdhC family protein [Gemmatimonadales bacterium]